MITIIQMFAIKDKNTNNYGIFQDSRIYRWAVVRTQIQLFHSIQAAQNIAEYNWGQKWNNTVDIVPVKCKLYE